MSTWAQVKENKKVGEGIFRLRLEAPYIAAMAQPGQFVMLRVSHGLDPLLARPFSIHGVDGGDILILYKVVGKGTRLLSLKRPGNKTLSLWGPLGRGFDLDAQRLLLVAGGMGIAPMTFAARTLKLRGSEKAFRLLYGITSKFHMAWDESDSEGSFYPAYGIPWDLATEDGSQGHHGLVTDLLLEALDSDSGSHPEILACGPMPMLKAVAQICAQRGVPCQVSLEAPMACGLGACLGCVIPAAGGGYVRACQEGPVMDAALVDWTRL